MLKRTLQGMKLLFVVSSILLWTYVIGGLLLDYPAWESLKKQVNVVNSTELPNGGTVAVLEEWKSWEGYSTYFLYRDTTGVNRLYYIEHDAPKFPHESCEIEVSGKDVRVVDHRGYYVRCRFDIDSIEYSRGDEPPKDSVSKQLNDSNDLSDVLYRKVPHFGT